MTRHALVSILLERAQREVNPVIVIPTYWTETDGSTGKAIVGSYDHATPIAKPVPELEMCLSSLDKVRGVLRVVVLLVAPPRCEESARARVNGICGAHPHLNALIVGSPEAAAIRTAVHAVAPNMEGETISLRGYGAIRNLGLVVAAILGHDIVVFMDDDEVALNENFLIDAVYGLGLLTRQELPVSAKSGFFLNRKGSCYADEGEASWAERRWTKRSEFNTWMRSAQSATRISRSNYVCGGCFAVHADAFSRVAFDPYITRGEDLDYLFNLRMYGLDVWFDNQWCVRHLPPKTASEPGRFLQDVYRWTYESEKLSAANERIGLHKVTPDSLSPYPGPWISPEVFDRIAVTSLLKTLQGPEHGAYFRIWARGRGEARRWAQATRDCYFSFQTYWPNMMAQLWGDEPLAKTLLRSGAPRVPQRKGRARP